MSVELAAVQAGFNRMAERITADAASLREARDDLEARVAAQTAELREAKERLERLVEELRALDKLKSDFMAVVSHELLTPINFIEGFGSALEDELLGPLTPAQADAVAKLMGGAARLTRMVRNTLEYTKALSGDLHVAAADLDFAGLVEEAASVARPKIEAKHQALTLEVPPDLPLVRADGDRVVQVLAELLDNAAEFSPEGAAIAVRVSATADGVTTEVANRGEPIPEAVAERLFEPFYQADSTSTRAHGGLGLGLPQVRHLVGRMGGTLVLSSTPEAGTRFWFTLPTAAAQARREAPGLTT
jgi:signal transduction histidine kinase